MGQDLSRGKVAVRRQRQDGSRIAWYRDRLPVGALALGKKRGGVRANRRTGVRIDPKFLKDRLLQIDGDVYICSRRAHRREALFKQGIAGRGKRRSPGQGGTYRRTDESSYTCEKVR